MKFLNLILVLTGLITLNANAQTKVDAPEEKLEKDRKAIKSLAGFYEVNFNYGEVTAPDPNYKFSKPYESHGNEWTEIIVDEAKRIVIQHMLAINSFIVDG
ncbi:DUF6607 family protein [Pedobacter borealis]|uniref:DUF6607 family protein n=1 Tax=Pedobacter borealis TaxID=475254 RepID=UPI000493B508|nr:DUF6607 family protein [Pedobacter borealis]